MPDRQIISLHFMHEVMVFNFVLIVLSGLRGSGIQKSIVVGIIFVRYVFLPLTGILIIKGALKFGLVHSDPLYLFVLLIQYTLPPAMNIGNPY